jgi:ABC-2 type transport system ATP-binding protein
LTIKFDGLTKVFSKKLGPAIESVSFEVADGEIVGFVGLNGAGKTTTIRVAAGVSLPTAGSASVDGYDIVNQKVEASRRVGWVPEIPNFEPNATAISLMEYFAGFYGVPAAQARSRSGELLKSVSLEDSANKKIRSYSQGMKKRFSLAASMLSDPKNFLFDEVLNGLDPEGIHYFRQLMLSMKQQGKAVLLSSHILLEVESLADRVVFIHKGKIIRTIRSSELASVGESAIRIVVNNIDDRCVSYLRGLGEVKVDFHTVFLKSAHKEPAELNSELVKMGYEVAEVSIQKEGLEQYFLKLVSGGG